MQTQEKALSSNILTLKFHRNTTVRYVLVFTFLCITFYYYSYTTTTTFPRSLNKYSSWNFTNFFESAFNKMKNTTRMQVPRERKLALLWTNYFSQSNWLPRTSELHCPVQECDITSNRSLLSDSSAVIMHWRNINSSDLPPDCTMSTGNASRKCPILVLFNKEAPPHTYPATIKQLNNKIHLIASYRKDSDVYAPYGKIVKRTSEYKTPKLNPKRNSVCWLVSHCKTQSKREVYVKNLKRYIDVDVYGVCGKHTCPHSDALDCYRWLSQRYKFYLSFENSICRDYVTEKLYYAMMTDMVPIVIGGENYTKYLPPHSFIDVADYADPSMLARYLKELNEDENSYLEYFKWKKDFEAEFVPFMWFCDVCAWMHNSTAADLKPHKDVISWWYGGAHCGSAKWSYLFNSYSYKIV